MTNAAVNHHTIALQLSNPDEIATTLCSILIDLQTEHPEWIHARFRNISFADKRTNIIKKLSSILQTCSDKRHLIDKVVNFLEQLLDPAVADTPFYAKVARLILSEASSTNVPIHQNTALEPSSISALPRQSSPFPAFSAKKIAILLLDAENIDLNEEAETWLDTCCDLPLSLKFAFGNWKKLGTRDENLHRRGYHLIHVSAGKNHADSKMTIIGSSLLVHLPSIGEVIVCSNDGDLNDLQSTLRFQGLNVRRLKRHQQTLTLTHSRTREAVQFELPTLKQMPSVKVGTSYCRQYLSQSSETQISLSQLSLAFSKEFGFPLSDFVKHHKLGRSPKVFFQNSPEFQISFETGSPEVHVEVQNAESLLPKANSRPGSQSTKEFTAPALKAVSTGIVKHLLGQSAMKSVPVGTVALTFYQQHGRSMKSVLTKLELKPSIPAFLASCQELKVEKDPQHWLVSISK